jgi:asparagine synthase (glutamine-hydrolysing)
MCGICGIFSSSLRPLDHPERIEPMSACLVHRGPDSDGVFERPWLAMAIRRLSIIDLETGDQPLSNETGQITLVFNGEIYNFRELRRQLEERGHRFRTHSDGEVIVHLYEDQGTDFVRELNGMFAIALWDEARQRLILARDRAGEKPLYYWLRDSTLVFASELKAILQYPDVARSLNPQALGQYLFYGYVPSPLSVFAEIKKLPAGHQMIVEQGHVCLKAYWRLQDYLRKSEPAAGAARNATAVSEEKLIEELRCRLREAAISRLVSDVPLGVFLSGGLDSSTVVALMSELAPRKVNTFSVAFAEKSFNEEPYFDRTARHFSTRHHVLRADEAMLREGLLSVAERVDEPLADPAIVPTYLLSRFARSQVKVALSGEGSDELFGGYPTYLGAQLARYYLRLPAFIRHQVFERLQALLPVSSDSVPIGLFLRRFLSHAGKEPAVRHQIWFGMFSPGELDELFRGCPRLSGDCVFHPLREVTRDVDFENELAEAMALDFSLYLADDLLVKVDRAGMACSLELRTPFLDHRLIEFAAALPAALKVRRFRMKYLLKKAVEPWLPREIVTRQKRGFSVPVAHWLRSELRPTLEELLGEERLKRQGLFDSVFVRRLLREHLEGKADHRKPLWTLLAFQLWYEHWAV